MADVGFTIDYHEYVRSLLSKGPKRPHIFAPPLSRKRVWHGSVPQGRVAEAVKLGTDLTRTDDFLERKRRRSVAIPLGGYWPAGESLVSLPH